ncbi:MAG TPA: cytochrome c [Vicinamibacterales bacterium]|nr:cytochrome c [Vicinamibacterales bacterium]
MNKESVSMRGVSGLLASVALVWAVVMASSVLAQTPPAGPAAVPAEAKKMKAAFPSSPAAIGAGKVLYAKYCRFCHGTAGAGDSTMAPKTMKPSNLTDAEWTRGSTEGEIFWVIQNGAPPKYDMKGLKGKISDADTWNLVHFVRSLGGAGK